MFFSNNLVFWSQPSAVCHGYGGPVNCNPSQTKGPALNLSAFSPRSAVRPSENIPGFSTTFDNIRQDNANNLDASLLKNLNINKATYFQLRFEGFGVRRDESPGLWCASVSSPTSSTFGLISASSTPQVNAAHTPKAARNTDGIDLSMARARACASNQTPAVAARCKMFSIRTCAIVIRKIPFSWIPTTSVVPRIIKFPLCTHTSISVLTRLTSSPLENTCK